MSRLNVEYLEDRLTPGRPGSGGTSPPPPPVITNPDPVGLTPAQVQHAYGFDQIAIPGGYNNAGAGQTIAIVMAGHDPNIVSDLNVFSSQFGLPTVTAGANFVQLNEKGSTSGPWPKVNASWAGEISLDVEWAHAIAPGAKIVLVEASSANVSDLVAAINTARNYPGVSAVSMSWGLLQGRGMDAYETYFTTPATHDTPITFVAATLDNGQTFPNNLYWPSVSPHVLAVGGTSMTVDAAGNYLGETAWGPSTGGISTWFAQPDYQKGVVTQTTQYRAVPDVSYHADNTVAGFAVYDTVTYNGQTGWFNAYGDSAGTPQWAALITIANQLRTAPGTGLTTLDGATQVLPGLYALAAQDYASHTETYFHDIQSSGNGKYLAGPGYDLATGLGTPKADALVSALATLTGSGTGVAFASTSAGTFGGTATAAGGFGESLPVPFPAQAPNHLSATAAEHLPPRVEQLFFLAPSEAKHNPGAWWNPGE